MQELYDLMHCWETVQNGEREDAAQLQRALQEKVSPDPGPHPRVPPQHHLLVFSTPFPLRLTPCPTWGAPPPHLSHKCVLPHHFWVSPF